MKNSLVIFARAPVAGQTKTRLARAVGDEAAAAFAAAMLRDTLDTARRWEEADAATGSEASIAFSPPNAFAAAAASLAAFWAGNRFAQSEGDIGARMLAALQHERARGCERIVLIGSDAPELTAPALFAAFEALAHTDLFVGPAHDGGFYLFGASIAIPDALFHNVKWSSPRALEQTLANARQLELSFALGPALHDIDEIDDVPDLQQRLKTSGLAPHTRRALQSAAFLY